MYLVKFILSFCYNFKSTEYIKPLNGFATIQGSFPLNMLRFPLRFIIRFWEMDGCLSEAGECKVVIRISMSCGEAATIAY